MPIYFQKKNGEDLTEFDFSALCTILPCEIFGGCPYFGPFDNKTFEFTDRDADRFDPIREIMLRQGYKKTLRPLKPRNPPLDWYQH
jgi:hypothetical protein